MNLVPLNCRKFKRLCEDREDRNLKPREDEFVRTHRASCEPCRQHEFASRSSLNMLRAMSLDVTPTDEFDVKLVRRVRLNQGRDRFAYWFPAVLGAGIASFAMFALMQLVTSSRSVQPLLRNPMAQARNSVPRDQTEPQLLLKPFKTRTVTR